MWIKNEVNILIEKHSTNNPFEIADHKNINVHFHPLHKEILRYYKYIRKNKHIVINSGLNSELKLFTCAHELGHSEFHPKLNTPFLKRKTLLSVDKIENEANRFAVELLIPDNQLNEYMKLSIYEIARIFGVPKELVHLKKYEFS